MEHYSAIKRKDILITCNIIKKREDYFSEVKEVGTVYASEGVRMTGKGHVRTFWGNRKNL